MSTTANPFNAVGDEEPINQWRSSTLALVRREAPHRLAEQTTASVETVVTRINRVMDLATTSASTTTTTAAANGADTRDTALRALVTSAADLARLLAVQKAALRVFFPAVAPHRRLPFDPDTMEDVGGGDDEVDGVVGREVRCVAFPGIIKHGDEMGGHLQLRNVLCKARVICE